MFVFVFELKRFDNARRWQWFVSEERGAVSFFVLKKKKRGERRGGGSSGSGVGVVGGPGKESKKRNEKKASPDPAREARKKIKTRRHWIEDRNRHCNE